MRKPSEGNATARKFLAEAYQNLTYYVIPHSHTDAGWWLTYDIYYQSRVKHILTSMYDYMYDQHLNQTSEG
jgi:hypothetical protein